MGLYLGSDGKRKVIINGIVYCLNFIPETFIIYGIKLLSSDDYTLRDVNGKYLTTEDGEDYGD